MLDTVFNYLASQGRTSLEDLILRVSVRPHLVVESLKGLESKGYIRIDGEKSIADLDAVIQRIRQSNGYDSYDKVTQRASIVRELLNNEPQFDHTDVELTSRGALASRIPQIS